MSYFKKFQIHEWQQFRHIDIEFDPRLTILTGANATGKTTILNILARHTRWDIPSLAVPRHARLDKVVKFVGRVFLGKEKNDNEIGSITYENGRIASLMIPQISSPSYAVSIGNQETVPGFFVPSHRSVYRYQQLTTLPAMKIGKHDAFQRVSEATHNRYFGGNDIPSSFHMKEMLISWNIFGHGNQNMVPIRELLDYYESFEEILRRVMPISLGFRRFSIRNMEIVLECDSGDFMIDGASGGLSTVIDLAWQIYMFSTREQSGFTVIIDEVENHLHPTMQRRLLGDFITAFPMVRFIVSTHSPLMVTSVRDSSVYVLRYDEDKTVYSQRLDFVNKARTATEILDEVLGVSSTLPPWAEKELNSIVSRFSTGPINEDSFTILKQDMGRIGLAEYLPQALGKILDARQ